MLDIKLTEADKEELRNIFISQAAEILDNLPGQIMAVEENPAEENWNSLKRSFHTLKGDSKAMGFDSLGTFAHKVEDLIAAIKDKEPDKASIDLLLECSDAVRVFLDKLANNDEPDMPDTASKIESYIGGYMQSAGHSHLSGSSHPRFNEGGQGGGIFRSLPFLRIEPERVDRIMNLVGELVIGRSMMSRMTAEMANLDRDTFATRLEGLNSAFEKTLSDLQRSVMKVRMLPVDIVFRRFPRLVRDLSSEKGKLVNLRIQGEKTELDKGIVDAIGEPLLHIVRNAIDHGIETPGERRALGKPEEGLICIRAFHQGTQIVIEVEDDGRGIDVDKLKEKAVQKNIITEEDAGAMGVKEAINLIFASGFSTAENITEVSGRGVGMDIVKNAVESLRGMIDISSEKNRGVTMTLRLPLTLAIIKSVLFSCRDKIFALPLTSVIEILRVLPENLETIAGNPVLRHREGIVPLLSIDGAKPSLSTFSTDGIKGAQGLDSGINKSKLFIILIGVGRMRAGLITEKIIGEEELVTKALDAGASSGLASGASILGDGRIVLILDPLSLIKRGGKMHDAGYMRHG